ncbi:MAG TPA: cytochrome c3 family protein [Longimicrobiales bacterium]|nr:cytochrome c3 family protein [Longimicrobiales bacterium]
MSALPVLLLMLQLLAPAAPGTGSPASEEGFPHSRHARLFPLCTGCHAGIEAGIPAAAYPEPATCERCHDGTRAARVTWTGAKRPASNLTFSHPIHATRVDADCGACHATGSAERMSVGGPRPDLCLRCHGGGEHLEAADRCQRCHLPLGEVRSWSTTRIAALPRPGTHASTGFLHEHGTAADGSCATCHARESCDRCHLNGEQLDAVKALARDDRVATLLAGRGARYARPASHTPEWEWRHGADARRNAATCASCHAQASCRACHSLPNAAVVAQPVPSRDDPRGVRFRRAPRVHPAGFEKQHQARGATEAACTGCHDRASCTACHAGSRDPEFHDRNFVARHGPESFGSEMQCSSCHSSELFCRSCHQGAGRSAAGRADVVYHGGSTLWLVGHGQAARQSLESCASCHAQNDCARCHSARGGWGINPHGSGFAANRLGRQSRGMCLRCHRSGSPGAP